MTADILFILSALSALVGAIGALRFPDFYTRIHALTMVSVGGAILGLIVLAAGEGVSVYSIKTLAVIAFIMATSPAGSHAIGQAAHASGQKPIASVDMLAEMKKTNSPGQSLPAVKPEELSFKGG